MTIRIKPIPRLALRRDEAAASVGVSPSKFDEWVREGRMPMGRKVDKGVVLYDMLELEAAWNAMKVEAPVDRAAGWNAPSGL